AEPYQGLSWPRPRGWRTLTRSEPTGLDRRRRRRVIRLISALLILWLGVAPARADELSELVDRHLQWRGGEAFAAVEALSSVGELETAGLTGEVRMLIRRDGSLRQSVDLGVVRNAEGVGPAGAWRVSESGQLEDMAADSL